MDLNKLLQIPNIKLLTKELYDRETEIKSISITFSSGDLYWIKENDFVIVFPTFMQQSELESVIKSLSSKNILGYLIIAPKNLSLFTINKAEKFHKSFLCYDANIDSTNFWDFLYNIISERESIEEFLFLQLKYNLINLMNTKYFNEKNILKMISIFLDRECYLLSSKYNILYFGKYNAPSDIPLLDWSEKISNFTKEPSYRFEPLTLSYNENVYLCFPLKSEKNILGFLCIENKHKRLNDISIPNIYELLPFLLICASQEYSSKLIKIKTFNDFLKNILYRFTKDIDEIKKETLKYDIDYLKNRFVWIIDVQPLSDKNNIENNYLLDEILDYTKNLSQKIFYKNIFLSEKTTIISIQEKEDILDEVYMPKYKNILNSLEFTFPEFKFYFGFSRAYEKLDELSNAYEEAIFSISIGKKIFAGTKNIFNYNDLLIYHLLFDQKDNTIIKRLYYNTIFLIINHDLEKGDVLIDTLVCLISNNFNYTLTADELFIHRNTLYQRLSRIESIIKMSIKTAETRLLLNLGIKYKDIIEVTGDDNSK